MRKLKSYSDLTQQGKGMRKRGGGDNTVKEKYNTIVLYRERDGTGGKKRKEIGFKPCLA